MCAQNRVSLQPDIRVNEYYDTNAFNQAANERSEFVTEFNPRFILRGTGERNRGLFSVATKTRLSSTFSELNATDIFLRGEGSRSLTRRLSVFSNGFLTLLDSTDEIFEDGVNARGDAITTSLQGRRSDAERRGFTGGVRYLLDPRTSLSLSAGFNETEFDKIEGSRRDSDAQRLSLNVSRAWSPYSRTFLNLQQSYNHFEKALNRPERDSDILSGSVGWAKTWNPRWQSTTSIGMSRVDSGDTVERFLALPDDDDPLDDPTLFQDTTVDDVSTSINGTFSITRKTERTEATFSFLRQTRPSAGFGADVNVDRLSAHYQVKLSSRFGVRGTIGWAHSSSASDTIVRKSGLIIPDPDEPLGFRITCPGADNFRGISGGQLVCAGFSDSATDVKVLNLRLRLGYKVNSLLSTFFQWSFTDRNASGDTDEKGYNEHRVSLGVRYSFELGLY